MRRICGVVTLVLVLLAAIAAGNAWAGKTSIVSATASDEEAFYQSQILPMALNVYYEARGEKELGQMMVAYVTLKRAEDNREQWGGNRIVDVVFKKKQFSWASKSKIAKLLPHGPAWDKAIAVATWVALGFFEPPAVLVDARYYVNSQTAEHKNLCWMATTLMRVGFVGNHDFYREPAPGEKPKYIPSAFKCS